MDREAFGQLIHRYANRIINLAYRFTRNRQTAEDISQEVFLKAYSAIQNLKPDASLSSWLYRITVNTCLNYLRDNKLRNAVSIDAPIKTEEGELTFQLKDPSPLARDTIDDEATRGVLAQELGRLPPDQRAALLLAGYEGLKYKDIAGILGCSVKAVERKIARARERLKRRIRID